MSVVEVYNLVSFLMIYVCRYYYRMILYGNSNDKSGICINTWSRFRIALSYWSVWANLAQCYSLQKTIIWRVILRIILFQFMNFSRNRDVSYSTIVISYPTKWHFTSVFNKFHEINGIFFCEEEELKDYNNNQPITQLLCETTQKNSNTLGWAGCWITFRKLVVVFNFFYSTKKYITQTIMFKGLIVQKNLLIKYVYLF